MTVINVIMWDVWLSRDLLLTRDLLVLYRYALMTWNSNVRG